MYPTYSDRPRSDLAELVAPSLDRIGRLVERRQGDAQRVCLIITRVDHRHFNPNGNIAVGVAFPGDEDMPEAEAKAITDELVIETLTGALENFAQAAGYPLTIVRTSSN